MEMSDIADSIARDTLLKKVDSTQVFGVDTTKMDSLQLAIYHHNKAIDDSIRLDSINRQRAGGINSPVNYSANARSCMMLPQRPRVFLAVLL